MGMRNEARPSPLMEHSAWAQPQYPQGWILVSITTLWAIPKPHAYGPAERQPLRGECRLATLVRILGLLPASDTCLISYEH